jgi:hypothetical protein
MLSNWSINPFFHTLQVGGHGPLADTSLPSSAHSHNDPADLGNAPSLCTVCKTRSCPCCICSADFHHQLELGPCMVVARHCCTRQPQRLIQNVLPTQRMVALTPLTLMASTSHRTPRMLHNVASAFTGRALYYNASAHAHTVTREQQTSSPATDAAACHMRSSTSILLLPCLLNPAPGMTQRCPLCAPAQHNRKASGSRSAGTPCLQ